MPGRARSRAARNGTGTRSDSVGGRRALERQGPPPGDDQIDEDAPGDGTAGAGTARRRGRASAAEAMATTATTSAARRVGRGRGAPALVRRSVSLSARAGIVTGSLSTGAQRGMGTEARTFARASAGREAVELGLGGEHQAVGEHRTGEGDDVVGDDEVASVHAGPGPRRGEEVDARPGGWRRGPRSAARGCGGRATAT